MAQNRRLEVNVILSLFYCSKNIRDGISLRENGKHSRYAPTINHALCLMSPPELGRNVRYRR